MIDYALKSKVLKSGLCEVQRGVSKALFLYDEATPLNHCKFNYIQAWNIDKSMCKSMPIEWHEAEKINHASYQRKNRLQKRIETMLQKGTCLFLTLTFTNEVLSSTSIETRRTYIARFLKSLNCEYVANIDFGANNGREHYHAIVHCCKIDFSYYTYGNIDFKKIKKSSDCVKLAKYVSKLTNHAIKETTKRNAILYSR